MRMELVYNFVVMLCISGGNCAPFTGDPHYIYFKTAKDCLHVASLLQQSRAPGDKAICMNRTTRTLVVAESPKAYDACKAFPPTAWKAVGLDCEPETKANPR